MIFWIDDVKRFIYKSMINEIQERFVNDKVCWMCDSTPYYTLHPVLDTEDNYREKYRYMIARGESLIANEKQILKGIQSENLRAILWISVQIISTFHLKELFSYKYQQIALKMNEILFGSSQMTKQDRQLAQLAQKLYKQIVQDGRVNCDQPSIIVENVMKSIHDHKSFTNINKEVPISIQDQQLKQRFLKKCLPGLRQSLQNRIISKLERRLQLVSQEISPILNTEYDHSTGALFVDRLDTTQYQLTHNFGRISFRISSDKLSRISKAGCKTLQGLHKANQEIKSLYEDIYNKEQNMMTLEALLKKMAHSTDTASQLHNEMKKLKEYLIMDMIEQIIQYQRLMEQEYPIINSKSIIYNTRTKKFSLTLQNIILKNCGGNLNDGLPQQYMSTQNNYFSNKGRNTNNYDQLLIVLDYFNSHCCYASNESILKSHKQLKQYGKKQATQEILYDPALFQETQEKLLHSIYTAKLSALKGIPLNQLLSKPQNPQLKISHISQQAQRSLPHFLEIDKLLDYKSRITEMPRKCRPSNLLWLQIKVYEHALSLQYNLKNSSILDILHLQKFLNLFRLFQLCPKERMKRKIQEQAEKTMGKMDHNCLNTRLYQSQIKFFKALLAFMTNSINKKGYTYYSEDQMQKISQNLHTAIKRLPHEIKGQEPKENNSLKYGLVSLKTLLSLNINPKNCEIIQYHVLSLISSNQSSNLTTKAIEQRISDLISLSDHSSF